MANCQRHYFCVEPENYRPLSAATLAAFSLIFAAVGGISGNIESGLLGGTLWMAAVFELCRYLRGGKLVCLEKDVCAIGRVADVHPVGSDKSGLDEIDDDFTFDLILLPHAAEESPSEMIASDSNQGRFVAEQAPISELGLGYVGDQVAFLDIEPSGHRTEILHVEVKGCRVHDVCTVLKVMAFPTAAAMVLCSVPVLGWLTCLLVLLAVVIVTAIAAGIVWATTSNGALSDVMDPASGELVPANADGSGGDVVLVRGDWVYDAGHGGWNEIHPVRHAQKIAVDEKFMGGSKADPALVAEFKKEVYDPWCFEVGMSRDPLVVAEQGEPRNRWRIHPVIDGCRQPSVLY